MFGFRILGVGASGLRFKIRAWVQSPGNLEFGGGGSKSMCWGSGFKGV